MVRTECLPQTRCQHPSAYSTRSPRLFYIEHGVSQSNDILQASKKCDAKPTSNIFYNYWAAVRDLNASYHIGETIFLDIYPLWQLNFNSLKATQTTGNRSFWDFQYEAVHHAAGRLHEHEAVRIPPFEEVGP